MTTAEKLTTIAENQQKVYDAGHEAGVAQGEQNAKQEFWDAYQDYGNRRSYQYAFSGPGWNNKTFTPMYDIITDNLTYSLAMFQYTGITGDLAEILERHGVALDTSKLTQPQWMFVCASGITRIGELNLSSTYNYIELFYGCTNLETIDKLICNSGTKNQFRDTFYGCTSLKNITIENVMRGSVDFSACPLTKESITSIFNALHGTETGYTITLKQTAVESAFTDAEWEALKATKSNWTVALA